MYNVDFTNNHCPCAISLDRVIRYGSSKCDIGALEIYTAVFNYVLSSYVTFRKCK